MIARIFPFISWFKGYNKNFFRLDFISGITVALVLIPQSMAYAQLASLPAYYGLYAAFLPPIIASLFGSSRQLATGPVAMVSLMTAAALEPIATAGSDAFIVYAILLCLMVGIFQFLLGALRLGIVINFISHPVVNGFTNAGALIIATSQLSNLLGVSVEKAEHHYETIIRVFQAAANYIHWPTLILASLAFIIMFGLKKLNPKIPNVLVAVVVTTLISYFTGFETKEYVPAGSIQSENVRNLINTYNKSLQKLAKRSEERTIINKQILEMRKKPDTNPHEILLMEQRVAVLNLQVSEIKEIIMHQRTYLRSFLFIAAKSTGGNLFYLKGNLPAGAERIGKIWRLNVKNSALDTEKILMNGGGTVIGVIPRGLPAISVPKVDFAIALQLIPMVIIISLIGFMEAISIAKAMAAKTGQRLDPNQELIGQGLSNIIGSFGKSYPASGSFSRSAVNIQAGAHTGMSGVFTSLMVIVTLIFLTPLMYHLPQSVLAAIIMMAVLGLVNVSGFIHAWNAQKYDGLISVITFVGTLAFAPHLERGIIIGVFLSMGVSLFTHMRPSVVPLSLHPDGSYRNARRWNLEECKYLAMIRFNGSLFFASASHLEDQILKEISILPELKHVVIVGNGINALDASGVDAISTIAKRLRDTGLDVSFSGLNDSIIEVFRRSHLFEVIGEDHLFRNVRKAIDTLHPATHSEAEEKECPLKRTVYKQVTESGKKKSLFQLSL